MLQYRPVVFTVISTGPALDFSERLQKARLSQSELRRLIYQLTGELMTPYSINRWVKGKHAPPAIAHAFVELVSRIPPRELTDLLSHDAKSLLPASPEDEADE